MEPVLTQESLEQTLGKPVDNPEVQEVVELISELPKETSYTREDIHSILDIEGEYRLAGRNNKVDVYFFRHRFGEGKTTYGLLNCTHGDMFLSETQKQSKENENHFKYLKPDTDTFRIFGWKYLIGLIDEDKKGNVTDEIQNLWEEEKDAVQRLRKLTEQEDSGKVARFRFLIEEVDRQEDIPEILQRWRKQWEKSTWKNNVVFACTKRIELIKQKAFLREAERIMIDEGVEEGFIEKPLPHLEDIQRNLGVKRPPTVRKDKSDTGKKEKREALKQDYINVLQTDVEFREIEGIPTELQRVTREIFCKLLVEPVEMDSRWNTGLTPYVKEIDAELVNKFESLWKKVAKKKVKGGKTRIDLTYVELMRDQDLSGIMRLQRFESICEKLWSARNSRLRFKRSNETQEVTSLKLKKPMMYEIWDLSQNNRVSGEFWILDATTGKQYLNEILLNRFRYYHYLRDLDQGKVADPFEKPVDKNPDPVEIGFQYIGGGEKYRIGKETVSIQDKSYGSLKVDQLKPDYERYRWDWNVKNEKDSVTRNNINSAAMDELIRQLVRLSRKKNIGVVTYKDLADRLNERGVEATYFAQSEGTNELKEVEILFVIGTPRTNSFAEFENYLDQYRQVPEYLPDDHDRMRKVTKKTDTLVEYVDRIEDTSLGIVTEVDTYWNDYWKRNVEYPVFDAYFRKRYQFDIGGKVVRIGIDALNFIGDPEGTVTDLLNKMASDRYIVENWNKIDCPSVYGERDVVAKEGNSFKLRNRFEKWNKLSDPDQTLNEIASELGIGRSTVSTWKSSWEEKSLI